MSFRAPDRSLPKLASQPETGVESRSNGAYSPVCGGAVAVLALPGSTGESRPGKRVNMPIRIPAPSVTEIAANYAGTGMARSFFRPATGNTIEGYLKTPDYYHALRQPLFHEIRNGQYLQRRWQIGAGGKEINIEEVTIDYVVGSENHARSYLHRTGRGMLIELPLGWYPDRGGEWVWCPGLIRNIRRPADSFLQVHVLPQRLSEHPGGQSGTWK